MILGCDKGFVFKFVRPVNDKKSKWERKATLKCETRVQDILQTKEDRILVCQDGGIYDYVDFNTMNPVSHLTVP